MKRVYKVADLFCGAGGSTTGAYRAAEAMGVDIDLVAVNHWDVAIATHSANHPQARHACVNLDAARPEELVPEGYLDLLMASPECTHHSRARGGKPVSNQMRMSAWHIQRWCSTLDVRCVLVENVAEFQDWGPLLGDGKPDPDRKGWYFRAWTQALTAMGYAIDWRLLNAANYGDATTRTRFFLQARKDGSAIAWPDATHTPAARSDMFGVTRRWRAAAEVIDWGDPGHSLLTRRRPLSINTRRRIARGLVKFGGPLAAHYVGLLDLPDADVAALLHGGATAGASPKSPGEPLPTFTTSTGGGVCAVVPSAEPFLLGQTSNSVARSAELPVPTATTVARIGLVAPVARPFLLGQQSGATGRPIAAPLPTIATSGAIALVDPSLIVYNGTGETSPVDRPVPTITTKDRFGLVSPTAEPFLTKHYGTSSVGSVEDPVPTVTAGGGHIGLVRPFLVPQFGEAAGQAPRVHDVGQPLPAVTGHGAGALVQPAIVQMMQTSRQDGGVVRSVDQSLPTFTTKKCLAVAEPTLTPPADGEVDPRRLLWIGDQWYVLDIKFRMLRNRELARAMGFDDDASEYQFSGTVEQVTKQIGNAVAVNTAAALVRAVLGERVVAAEESA